MKKIIVYILVFNLISCSYPKEQFYYHNYENGNIRMINLKCNKEKNIQTILFHSNGKISQNIYLEDGKPNGISYNYFESGYIKEEVFYNKGLKQGMAYEYFDSLQSIKTMMYYNKEGKLLERNNYDRNGKLILKEGMQTPNILPNRDLNIITK